jgi:RNA recognition motif-containing protein
MSKDFISSEIKNRTNSRLYVGNLKYQTTNNDIREVFGKFGEIKAIQIKKGYAFIEYDTPKEANCAREQMNLEKFRSRALVVRPASKF